MTNLDIQKNLRVALVVPNFRWCHWQDFTLWHFIPYNLCLLAAMVEDICEHGVGHPNKEWLNEQIKKGLSEDDVWGLSVHGCDGCCSVKKARK